MTYTVSRLALGSYGVLLGGAVAANLVRNGNTSSAAWIAVPPTFIRQLGGSSSVALKPRNW